MNDTTDLNNGGRDFDARTLLRQIGSMNVLAISGGKVEIHPNGVRLPVRYGYAVEVFLADDDTYTVRTTFTRGAKSWVKGETTGVYFDQVGDAAYRASCYRDVATRLKATPMREEGAA